MIPFEQAASGPALRNGLSRSEAPPAELEASGSPLKGGEYVGKAPLGLN